MHKIDFDLPIKKWDQWRKKRWQLSRGKKIIENLQRFFSLPKHKRSSDLFIKARFGLKGLKVGKESFASFTYRHSKQGKTVRRNLMRKYRSKSTQTESHELESQELESHESKPTDLILPKSPLNE